MQCESRTESKYFFPQLVFIAYSYRAFSASALQWFIINSTQETSSFRLGNSWPVLLNAKRHTQWELRETFGIRVVCATFGIHGAGHCCKFHLILCHIASCPCRAVAHASDIFTLNMQNFQHSKFSLWPSPDTRTSGQTSNGRGAKCSGPTCQVQIFKIIFEMCSTSVVRPSISPPFHCSSQFCLVFVALQM